MWFQGKSFIAISAFGHVDSDAGDAIDWCIPPLIGDWSYNFWRKYDAPYNFYSPI